MATLFLDFEGGNNSNDGTTFANRVLTLTRASALVTAGDTLKVMDSSTPNSLGVNGTFVNGATFITLASAVNVTLDQGESAWTASANVTCTTSTTRKQGATSASTAIGASFTTGLAAYKALGASTDLSAYQQVSFWIQQTAGTLSANCSIRICTDTVGATSVNTFTIPAPQALSQWHRVTINLGSAMSAAAQSIALYADTDQGAQTFLIDNIVACKAPGTGELTHKTLIGKLNSIGGGGTDAETWYSVRDITTTTVTLERVNSDSLTITGNSGGFGYFFGVSETVTAYSILPSYVPLTATTADFLFNQTGTSGSHITISGGWNRTDMTTQTGQTIVGLSFVNTNLGCSLFGNYLDLSKISFFGFTGNFYISGGTISISTLHWLGNTATFVLGLMTSTITGLVVSNSSVSLIVNGAENTISCSLYYPNNLGLSSANLLGSVVTFTNDSICFFQISPNSQVVFNGTTYGIKGPATILGTALTEAYRTNGATGTLTQLLYEILAMLTEHATVGTTLTTKKLDHSTTAATHTLDSATSPTSITRAT